MSTKKVKISKKKNNKVNQNTDMNMENTNIVVPPKPKRPSKSKNPLIKLKAIVLVEGGETKASVARDMDVPESTLRGWMKSKDRIRAAAQHIPEAQMYLEVRPVSTTSGSSGSDGREKYNTSASQSESSPPYPNEYEAPADLSRASPLTQNSWPSIANTSMETQQIDLNKYFAILNNLNHWNNLVKSNPYLLNNAFPLIQSLPTNVPNISGYPLPSQSSPTNAANISGYSLPSQSSPTNAASTSGLNFPRRSSPTNGANTSRRRLPSQPSPTNVASTSGYHSNSMQVPQSSASPSSSGTIQNNFNQYYPTDLRVPVPSEHSPRSVSSSPTVPRRARVQTNQNGRRITYRSQAPVRPQHSPGTSSPSSTVPKRKTGVLTETEMQQILYHYQNHYHYQVQPPSQLSPRTSSPSPAVPKSAPTLSNPQQMLYPYQIPNQSQVPWQRSPSTSSSSPSPTISRKRTRVQANPDLHEIPQQPTVQEVHNATSTPPPYSYPVKIQPLTPERIEIPVHPGYLTSEQPAAVLPPKKKLKKSLENVLSDLGTAEEKPQIPKEEEISLDMVVQLGKNYVDALEKISNPAITRYQVSKTKDILETIIKSSNEMSSRKRKAE